MLAEPTRALHSCRCFSVTRGQEITDEPIPVQNHACAKQANATRTAVLLLRHGPHAREPVLVALRLLLAVTHMACRQCSQQVHAADQHSTARNHDRTMPPTFQTSRSFYQATGKTCSPAFEALTHFSSFGMTTRAPD